MGGVSKPQMENEYFEVVGIQDFLIRPRSQIFWCVLTSLQCEVACTDQVHRFQIVSKQRQVLILQFQRV